MSEVWAIIVSIILAMILYAWISSKIKDRKKRITRENSVPYVNDNLSTSIKYNIHLNNGRIFKNITIIGSSQPDEGQFSFTGWEEMLILKQENNKRVFLKQASIRFIEEL